MRIQYAKMRVFIVIQMVHQVVMKIRIVEVKVADMEGTEDEMKIEQGIEREDEMLIALMIVMTKMLKGRLYSKYSRRLR